mgnify:CR=1 FL=1
MAYVAAWLTPSILAYLMFSVLAPASQYRPVNKNTCDCSCWDGKYKVRVACVLRPRVAHAARQGAYDLGGYKSVYFNIDRETWLIWTVTLFYLHALSMFVKRTVHLAIRRRLSIVSFTVIAVSIYPNIYSWWMFYNYWNDRYYLYEF